MDKLRSVMQPVKLINLILIIICIFGFSYQVCLILKQYMLGKTVVNIEVKILKDQPLPAITIFNPALISIQKLLKLKSPRWNKSFNGLIHDYTNFFIQILNSNANDTTLKSLESKMEAKYNDIFKKNQFDWSQLRRSL